MSFLAVVFIAMLISPGDRISIYVGIPFILILTATHYATGQQKKEAEKNK